jgi:hypothetical protein
MATFDPQLIDHLDASLQDFEPSSPPRDDYGFSPAPQHLDHYPNLQQQHQRSGGSRPRSPSFDGSETAETEISEPASTGMDESRTNESAGGYSPPAWRRLENGDRSNGFWRPTMPDRDNDLTVLGPPLLGLRGVHSRQVSPEYVSADEGEEILDRASRTRLPTGSLSPERMRSPEPRLGATKLKVEDVDGKMMASLEEPQEPSKNCK